MFTLRSCSCSVLTATRDRFCHQTHHVAPSKLPNSPTNFCMTGFSNLAFEFVPVLVPRIRIFEDA